MESSGQSRSLEDKMRLFQHICEEEGLKLTHQRLEILRELDKATDHPSAETIHKRVQARIPTISLDTSTGDLYAFWISLDDNNIDCKKNDSELESWSFVTLGGQNSNEKHYLTSIYSVSGESYICWQWTQNTTGNIEVIFDVIPEFEDVLAPILIMIAIFFVGMRKRRHRLCIDR